MLNWRQILIHFLAAWFFMHAFQTLAVLYDTELFDIINQSDKKNIDKVLIENGTSASDLVNFSLWIYGARTIGLLVAFIISLTISIRKRWFWANSLIVLVVTYLLAWFDLLGWTFLKKIVLMPMDLFKTTTSKFLSNGIILLAIGILMLFSRKLNQFIQNRNDIV